MTPSGILDVQYRIQSVQVQQENANTFKKYEPPSWALTTWNNWSTKWWGRSTFYNRCVRPTSPHQYPLGQPDARVFQCQLDIGGTLGPFPVWWPHDMRVDSQDLVFQSLTYFTYLACANCFVCAVWTWAAVLRKKEYCSPDSMQSPTSTASAAKPLLAGNMWVAYLTSKHF